jgi:hypothetical protein
MTQKTFSFVAGLIFLLIVLVHLSRIVFRWEVILIGRPIPLAINWVAMIVFGYPAYEGFRRSRSSQ